MSFFVIGPIPAFMTGICFCLSKTSRASRLPRESAFTTIPCSSVWISSSISSENSSDIFLNVFSSVITWNGIPGRISSFDMICNLIPVAASTLFSVLYPLFKGWASWMFLIFVWIASSSIEAIAISSVLESLPSYNIHSKKFIALSFFTSRTTPFPCSFTSILSFRNFCESAVSIARISLIPSPVCAEHGTIATFFVKSSIFEYISAVIPCECRAPIIV